MELYYLWKLPLTLDFYKAYPKGMARQLRLANPDGSTVGKLESFNIGSTGEINGVYSNGKLPNLGHWPSLNSVTHLV